MNFTQLTLSHILKLLFEFDFTLNVSLIGISQNLQGSPITNYIRFMHWNTNSRLHYFIMR